MERWTGRVAIVTGASSGIGEAIARILVENGMKVIGAARRLDRLEALATSLKDCKGQFHAAQCDVTKEDDVIRVVKWARENWGGADVLVNNAGVAPACPLVDFKTENAKKILDLNVLGLCLCTREVVKDMRDRGVDDGHIFHICSVAGHTIVTYPGVYVYSGSKHAVKVMAEGLRRELRDLGTKIRVTNISPGFVKSEIIEASGASKEMANNAYAELSSLEARDIAEGVLFALSRPGHVQIHEMTIKPMGEIF